MKSIRHFIATAFVIKDAKTLLMMHKKLGMWLPPGGHVDEGELPCECAVREVEEETGLKVELLNNSAVVQDNGRVRILATPNHIQLEDIEPGHQHIDLVYIAKVIGGEEKLNEEEGEQLKWFSAEDLEKEEITDNIRDYGKIAIKKFSEVE